MAHKKEDHWKYVAKRQLRLKQGTMTQASVYGLKNTVPAVIRLWISVTCSPEHRSSACSRHPWPLKVYS